MGRDECFTTLNFFLLYSALLHFFMFANHEEQWAEEKKNTIKYIIHIFLPLFFFCFFFCIHNIILVPNGKKSIQQKLRVKMEVVAVVRKFFVS